MISTAPLDTLFLPFESGALAYPSGPTLFINAQRHAGLSGFASLDYIQPFYPAARALPDVVEEPSAFYAASLVLVPKDKRAARHDLARAIHHTQTGGLITAAAANDANGNRLAAWMEEAGLSPHTLSKNKCRVVWAQKMPSAAAPAPWIKEGERQSMVLDGETYITQPGLFGWNKIDAGSALLTAHLPCDLTGRGADFGCGYGYLSRAVRRRNNQALSVTGIDADRRAVACYRANIPSAPVHWADLTASWPGDAFDWIIMNPPFHAGKMTNVDIGTAFIKTAHGALKPGGRLYMVANRHLPYEKTLGALFTNVSIEAQQAGFKLVFAQK